MEENIVLRRVWAMPNGKTFSVKPIKEIIEKYIKELDAKVIVDPFANGSKFGTITNDIDPTHDTDYHMDAIEFLEMMDDNSADMVLYDPPYSPTQVKILYNKLEKTVDYESTSARYWSRTKEQIARILKPGGICITCGWNSGGVGKCNNMEKVEILLVPHGGMHNDTIVVVEKKKPNGINDKCNNDNN